MFIILIIVHRQCLYIYIFVMITLLLRCIYVCLWLNRSRHGWISVGEWRVGVEWSVCLFWINYYYDYFNVCLVNYFFKKNSGVCCIGKKKKKKIFLNFVLKYFFLFCFSFFHSNKQDEFDKMSDSTRAVLHEVTTKQLKLFWKLNFVRIHRWWNNKLFL